MRIAIGGLWHETNTFAAQPTGLEAFRGYQFARGDEILEKFAGTRTELGGFLDYAKSQGWRVVPTLYAAAVPSGIVSSGTFKILLDGLLKGLEKASDGVLLALHGAMVAEGLEDCEAEILKRVREAPGRAQPIVATFDIHANLSEKMVECADLLVGYDTYPHIDIYERGLEAARLLGELLETHSRPAKAFRKLPLLTVPQAQSTDSSPMKEVMTKVRALETQPGILCSSVAVGFPYADVNRVGASVLAYARDSAQLAESAAEDLASFIWGGRQAFAIQNTSPQEAVRRALSVPEGPVVLVDVADNVGGGAPGDGTVLLRALLEAGAAGAVVTLADAQAVEQAARAGVGSEVELTMGGKCDTYHGESVRARGRVAKITEAAYTHRGSYMTGLKVGAGKTAIVDCRGVQVMLTERRVMPFDAEQLRSVGIEPSKMRMIVVKSAIAWKAAYGDLAKEVIYVETPGICSSNLRQFDYRNIPRPIFPLDEI